MFPDLQLAGGRQHLVSRLQGGGRRHRHGHALSQPPDVLPHTGQLQRQTEERSVPVFVVPEITDIKGAVRAARIFHTLKFLNQQILESRMRPGKEDSTSASGAI